MLRAVDQTVTRHGVRASGTAAAAREHVLGLIESAPANMAWHRLFSTHAMYLFRDDAQSDRFRRHIAALEAAAKTVVSDERDRVAEEVATDEDEVLARVAATASLMPSPVNAWGPRAAIVFAPAESLVAALSTLSTGIPVTSTYGKGVHVSPDPKAALSRASIASDAGGLKVLIVAVAVYTKLVPLTSEDAAAAASGKSIQAGSGGHVVLEMPLASGGVAPRRMWEVISPAPILVLRKESVLPVAVLLMEARAGR